MISSPKKSHRQEAKERSKALKELYLLVQWDEKDDDDGESLFDVLPAKAIVDVDPLAVREGQKCSATFQKRTYPATILGKGTYSEMKNLQVAKEGSIDEPMDVISSEGLNDQLEVDAVDDVAHAVPESTPAAPKTTAPVAPKSSTTASPKSTTPLTQKKQSQTRKKTAQKAKSSPRKRLISPQKNKSQVKRSKTNPSADKAKSNESNRIGSLILASLDLEPPSTSAVSPVSSPKDDSQSAGSPKEEVPNQNDWSPDYGFDDTGMTDNDLDSVRSGITASSHPSRSSLDNTLSGRSSSGVISPPSFSMPRDLQYNSPTTSAVFGDCYSANGAGPSYSYSPFSPMPPYGMTHSQSWPPSDQGMCAQIMLALNSMRSEIQMLKTDMNTYKHKKRKRSREQSIAHSDISEPPTPGAGHGHPPPARAGVLLGDPYGENLFVEHPTITRKDVRSLEALSKSDQKLALALVDLFFPKDVQAASLATKKEDRELLDQNIIEGIRLHVMYKYPPGPDSTDWNKIVKAINDKCRNTKRRRM